MTSAVQALLRHADRVLADAGEVSSPCISICRMGPDGLCEGCWRNLDEIAEWSDLDDGERRVVWHRITQRARRALTGAA